MGLLTTDQIPESLQHSIVMSNIDQQAQLPEMSESDQIIHAPDKEALSGPGVGRYPPDEYTPEDKRQLSLNVKEKDVFNIR